MKVVCIGASGFIGTRTLDLLKNTHNCVNFDKSSSHFHSDITICGDITQADQLKRAQFQNTDTIVLLAAAHRDDVNPHSLYYQVNVEGTRNVLKMMDIYGITNIIFTSSVAVYGLNKENPNETHNVDPFNHYGKSKWAAEEVLREWYNKNPKQRSLTIIRPTVVFGERNRGNVYNLLRQIASGRFLMVGKGRNVKSMAYVGNVAAFLKYCVETVKPGYRLFNYADKPDLTMNELLRQVEQSLDKKIASVHLPYALGYFAGQCFDLVSKITGKKFTVSSVRIKKFCATTQFDAMKVRESGFSAPFTLIQGLDRTLNFEFKNQATDQIIYYSE